MSKAKIEIPRFSSQLQPSFFDDPANDQIMTFIVELAAELSVVYDRLDTVERVLETKGTVNRQDIETYRASDSVEAERMARRDAFLKRVFRMHPQAATADQGHDQHGD
jgi:hypothetical protein